MNCALCNKNKASFYRTIPALGKQVPVCVACLSKIASQGRISVSTPLNFDFIKQTVMDAQPKFVDFYTEVPTRMRNIVCSNCGFDIEQYSTTGRLGCSVCYDTFKDRLIPIIHKIHGCTKHNGSRPK